MDVYCVIEYFLLIDQDYWECGSHYCREYCALVFLLVDSDGMVLFIRRLASS